MATKRKAATETVSKKKEAKCDKLSPKEKEKLFNKYIVPNFHDIKTLTARYTNHYQDVDEDYNYVLAQMFHYIGSYNPSQSLKTWIHIVTKRACFHQNKKRAEEASHLTGVEFCSYEALYHNGNDNMVEAGFGTLADNLSDTMYAALMQIPPHRLSPFLLYAQGHGLREITNIEWKAGHLERRSEDIVKSRIFWARKDLQYILKKDGITRANHKGKADD